MKSLALTLTLTLTVFGPRQEWRATALASFDEVWRTVNETYYDPSFGGLDWVGVRAELRPKAESAASPDDMRQAIREMLARLKQSHFVLLSSAVDRETLPGEAVVPIEMRVVGRDVVITRVEPGSSAAANLHPGDRITRIDADEAMSPTGAEDRSPRAARLDEWQRVYRSLHGAPGSTARLTVRDVAGRERTVAVRRTVESGERVTLGNLPPLLVRSASAEVRTPANRRVGLIAFNIWMATVAEPIAAAVDRFRSADGLVIDLRGNPGGLAEMIRGIAGHVVATPELLGRVHMRGVDLEFRANPRRSTADGRRVEPFAGPLAVLVDELTASASECFAGGLQSLGRARVFGTQTMGQALPASTRRLSDGDVLMYAVGDFVTSNGRRLEGVGVIPDETVPLSLAALAVGRDEPLDAALAWIDRARP